MTNGPITEQQKRGKVYRWRIARSQIRHQGLWLWLLRRLR